jgi:hypothetical protein
MVLWLATTPRHLLRLSSKDTPGGRNPVRSCEKINNFTQRRQGAKTREEQLLCFLCAFYDFAPLREMLLLVRELFHSFVTCGSLLSHAHRVTGLRLPSWGSVLWIRLWSGLPVGCRYRSWSPPACP